MDFADKNVMRNIAVHHTELLIKRLETLNINTDLLISGIPVSVELPKGKIDLIKLLESGENIKDIKIDENFNIQVYYGEKDYENYFTLSANLAERLGLIVHRK